MRQPICAVVALCDKPKARAMAASYGQIPMAPASDARRRRPVAAAACSSAAPPLAVLLPGQRFGGFQLLSLLPVPLGRFAVPQCPGLPPGMPPPAGSGLLRESCSTPRPPPIGRPDTGSFRPGCWSPTRGLPRPAGAALATPPDLPPARPATPATPGSAPRGLPRLRPQRW